MGLVFGKNKMLKKKYKPRGKPFEKGHPLLSRSIENIMRGEPSPRKGVKLSDETKRKISIARKGKPNPLVSAKLTGRKQSPEHIRKRVKKLVGKKRTIKTRLKMSKAQKKLRENHTRWKGGITPINEKVRKSLEYKLWRKAVFKRDDYTCVWCGQRGGKLQADYIKPFALFPELRFAIDNGRTLCQRCHKTTNTYGGKC